MERKVVTPVKVATSTPVQHVTPTPAVPPPAPAPQYEEDDIYDDAQSNLVRNQLHQNCIYSDISTKLKFNGITILGCRYLHILF